MRDRQPTTDSAKSYETTQTVETDISMPSHILIPNLPTISEMVNNINTANAPDDERGAPRSADERGEPRSEDLNSNSSTEKHVVDVVQVSNAKRATDEFGFFVDSISATPSSQLT